MSKYPITFKCCIFVVFGVKFFWVDLEVSKSTWGEQPVENIPNFTCICVYFLCVYVFFCVTPPGQTKNDKDLKFGTLSPTKQKFWFYKWNFLNFLKEQKSLFKKVKMMIILKEAFSKLVVLPIKMGATYIVVMLRFSPFKNIWWKSYHPEVLNFIC